LNVNKLFQTQLLIGLSYITTVLKKYYGIMTFCDSFNLRNHYKQILFPPKRKHIASSSQKIISYACCVL